LVHLLYVCVAIRMNRTLNINPQLTISSSHHPNCPHALYIPQCASQVCMHPWANRARNSQHSQPGKKTNEEAAGAADVGLISRRHISIFFSSCPQLKTIKTPTNLIHEGLHKINLNQVCLCALTFTVVLGGRPLPTYPTHLISI